MKLLTTTLIAALIAPALAFADPSGLWSRTNETGETHIRVAPAGMEYTGTIEWMETREMTYTTLTRL